MDLFKKHKIQLNYLLFEVSRRCNLACSYCYNHWKREGAEEENEPEGYEPALQTLKQLFKTSHPGHITFTGGEPMLLERLPELALFCRMKGATVSVITNGNAGNSADFAHLIKIGVRIFELPLHAADPAVHDRMTGTLGSWKNSFARMQMITRFGGTVVPSVVITRQNVNQIGPTLEFLFRSGFHQVMLNRYNLGGASAGNPGKVLPEIEDLNRAFEVANEQAGRFRMLVSSNVCTPQCVVNPQLYRNIRFTQCSVDVLQRPLTLTTGGNLRFCNHSPEVLGNIFREKPEGILARAAGSYPSFEKPSFCSDCARFDQCLGGCRAAAQQFGGSFADVDPVVFILKKNVKTATA